MINVWCLAVIQGVYLDKKNSVHHEIVETVITISEKKENELNEELNLEVKCHYVSIRIRRLEQGHKYR